MSRLGAVRLLAVDDDPEDLKLIATTLNQEGLEILTTEDAEAGFEVFEELASGSISASSGRTLLAGSDKRFVWASIAHIYGIPGNPDWADWLRGHCAHPLTRSRRPRHRNDGCFVKNAFNSFS